MKLMNPKKIPLPRRNPNNPEIKKYVEAIEKGLNKMSKNSVHLAAFTDFCRQHPDLRFWQALQVWSGYNFIFAGNLRPTHPDNTAVDFKVSELREIAESLDLKDMFYVED